MRAGAILRVVRAVSGKGGEGWHPIASPMSPTLLRSVYALRRTSRQDRDCEAGAANRRLQLLQRAGAHGEHRLYPPGPRPGSTGSTFRPERSASRSGQSSSPSTTTTPPSRKRIRPSRASGSRNTGTPSTRSSTGPVSIKRRMTATPGARPHRQVSQPNSSAPKLACNVREIAFGPTRRPASELGDHSAAFDHQAPMGVRPDTRSEPARSVRALERRECQERCPEDPVDVGA